MAFRLAGGTGVNATYGTFLRDSTSIIALSERHIEAFERAQPGVRAKTALIPAPPIMRVCSANDGDARRRGRRKLAVSEEEIILIYFGFIYPSKGLETLLRAFGQIPVLDAGLRLVIVGDSLDAAYLYDLRTASLSKPAWRIGPFGQVTANPRLRTRRFIYTRPISACYRSMAVCV